MTPDELREANALIRRLRDVQEQRRSAFAVKWWRRGKHVRLNDEEADLMEKLNALLDPKA